MHEPLGVPVDDAPSLREPRPAIDIFPRRIENRPDRIGRLLVPRLNIGAADGEVAVNINRHAADEVLGRSAGVQKSAHHLLERGDAAHGFAGAVVKCYIYGENLGESIPVTLIQNSSKLR